MNLFLDALASLDLKLLVSESVTRSPIELSWTAKKRFMNSVKDHRGTSISKSRQRCQSRQEKPQGLQLAQLSSLGLKVESQSDEVLRL